MASMTNKRVRLMLGCGGAALALSLAISAEKAQAQAFQGNESVAQGNAFRTVTGTNSETITVDTPTAVIDWQPIDGVDFLPTGAVVTFQNNGSDSPGADFAVLNRILPTALGGVVVLDGTVVSRIVDFQTGSEVAGGTVAFYSPTGILVGGNASFDVGNLILTTLEPDLASFDAFTTAGGTLQLNGGASPTARIQIDAGAQITASAENSYFAAIAADLQMLGTSTVNGSQAYVAGEVVNLTFSNGLFDIEVPIGAALGGQVMELNGNVGGPSSTGVGDNHLIYAVAKASGNPISMLFSGNLGFAPAATAGVVNGEIILSANNDVFGRTVQNGSISDGINAVFDELPDPFASPIARADILVEDFAATSSLLAIGSDLVRVSALNSASSVEGNLLVVGREGAEVTSSNGQVFDISGDLLASSRAFGVVGSSLQDPTLINAAGGTALIDVLNGGNMTISGNALVTADAVGGADESSFEAGSATGGSAQIGAAGGIISILGDTTVSARARGTTRVSLISTGAISTGGLAQILLSEGGSLTADSIDLIASANAAATITGTNGGDAFAGLSQAIIEGGSTLTLADFSFDATASTTAGGETSAGEALLMVGTSGGGGQVAVTDRVTMAADATGGDLNIAGRFEVSATSGQVSTANLIGTALGEATGDFAESRLGAVGGDILVSNALSIDVFDSFIVEAGQGNLIGGPDLIDPTVAVDITSQGTIVFLGDNDDAIDFGGLSMTLTSRDIAIENGARIGAVTMDLVSLDETAPAILGGEGTPSGEVTGEGYTLIAEEISRLEVGSFTFTQPVLPGAGTDDPDIILREATAFGSADPNGGVSDILIQTGDFGGIIRVDGLIELGNAAPTDTFTLLADNRIEVVTPGGIAISDFDGLPTGQMLLDASNIWVADADLITALQADRSFAGRNDELAVAIAVSADPLGYLRAGRVDLQPGQSLLVRNTGSETEQGGITVGDGGLFIRANENSESTLDVFAYGRRQQADGSFVTGSDFFSEVNFNINVGNTAYTGESELNDCVINTAECPTAVTPPPEPPVQPPGFEEDITEVIAVLNNPTTFEEVTEVPPEDLTLTERESNDEFGVDFPGLIEAPLLSEDPLLNDPVASGGDSSAYGAGGPEGGSHDE
ncbi:filamentous hemagglutinin family N-terminal domain-containing protein [Erythrobacter litoralis]|uniref:Filamentous haemagglutinin FhaB/tRNA nuclease CdiA-like TPS domain-containing protein n=2 Tax=Erythrobacter litoralis TaxID=39960 RepID=A0A074MJC8_9SPHN|nr:filamentous hemagglutinin family N-terminal domain-containing protein [Erythrobacter litoralis]KEO92910.1 hypothetical protein EH32_14050 [Erythrobacter litoralis]